MAVGSWPEAFGAKQMAVTGGTQYVRVGGKGRVNTVAPGVVDTPLYKDISKDFLKTLSPMNSISIVQEIVGGAHLGKW
jgi:NAD(P)-dependent dehydrogenase (short-subunit alcohol dehydrogenase family)